MKLKKLAVSSSNEKIFLELVNRSAVAAFRGRVSGIFMPGYSQYTALRFATGPSHRDTQRIALYESAGYRGLRENPTASQLTTLGTSDSNQQIFLKLVNRSVV